MSEGHHQPHPGADDDGLDAAWATFRRGLADWLAGSGLAVLARATDDVLALSEALVQLRVTRGQITAHLDAEPLDAAACAALPLVRPVRYADEVAAHVVHALRHGFGVLHPAFLHRDGLPEALRPPAPSDVVAHGREAHHQEQQVPLAVRVRDPDHLLELVADVLDPVEPDEDGDFPVPAGEHEVLFVRVHHHRALVEVFCDLAVEVEHPERLADELDILNRDDPGSTYFSLDGAVTVRRVLPASWFLPAQLRMLVGTMRLQVGQVGHDLRRRVGGRSFLGTVDREGAERGDPVVPGPEEAAGHGRQPVAALGFEQLLELLHAGPVPPAVVAELYDHDRTALVHDAVACRRDRLGCDVHDQEVLLAHLRAGPRHVATRAAEVRGTGGPPPRRVVSQQLPLIDDDALGVPTLPVARPTGGDADPGHWGA